MSVHEAGRRLKITDGPVTLTAFLDADGKIAISHGFFGLRLDPGDLRTVLDELAPEHERADATEAADHEVLR